MALRFRVLSWFCLAVLLLPCLTGCTPGGTRLITGGYGYRVGDIVRLDTTRQPAIGDIIQYNARTNGSDFQAFGPGIYLAKIAALPGDTVVFHQTSYEADGLKIELGILGKTVWGSSRFDNIAGMTLTVPENEFLSDKCIGYEWVGEQGDNGPPYRRYTIKREAIIGIVTKKLGHDRKFEEEQKNIIY